MPNTEYVNLGTRFNTSGPQSYIHIAVRSSLVWMKSSRVLMRSSRVVRAPDCQCQSRNSPEAVRYEREI
jgi:hypothetical protein